MSALVFGGGLFSAPVVNGVPITENTQIELLIGIKIQFPLNESDLSTSGNENFMLNQIDSEIDLRCEGFFVDTPPHNQNYFNSQMSAVDNYFNSVSNGSVNFETIIIDTILTASHNMAFYAGADLLLGDLFIEGIQGLETELENTIMSNFDNLELSVLIIFLPPESVPKPIAKPQSIITQSGTTVLCTRPALSRANVIIDIVF